MIDSLTARPLKVLLNTEETEVVMSGEGAWAPDNGAIPMYKNGGKRDGELMGYVSVLPALDGSVQILVHGMSPHRSPVSGCIACGGLLGR
jgi:hypothetical protein